MGDRPNSGTPSRARALGQAPRRAAWALCPALATLLLLLAPSLARAAFAQAPGAEGAFGGILEAKTPPPSESEFPEGEAQLGGTGGLAVNYTGAGGVPKGTLYAATLGEGLDKTARVAQYRPNPNEGELVGQEHRLEFALGWAAEAPYARCGPLLGLNGEGKPEHPCPKRLQAPALYVDVDVDESTGNVYVFNAFSGKFAITEFDPNGTKVIAQFGEKAAGAGKTSEAPAKIHTEETAPGRMAVTASGEVYVSDVNLSDNFYHRLMVFKPKAPGKFEEYEYAGEIAAGFLGESEIPTRPALDTAGHVYVAGEESHVQELATQAPEPYPAAHPAPVCSFEYPPGGITAMTVDPATGEPFFFTSKKEEGQQVKQIHQLSACSEGKFTETAKFEVSPERDNLSALAFDPVHQLTPARKPGTLYGAAPRPVPNTGGTGQPGMGALGYIFVQASEEPPTVEGESLGRVGERFAEVTAEVNAKSHQASYVFEYLSEAEYLENGESFEGPREPQRAPLGGGEAGHAATAVTVGATLTGLAPGTEYRFRAIATSRCKEDHEVICEGAGEAKALRTFPPGAGALPDGRAYELVSPAQKSGGQVLPAEPNLSSCTFELGGKTFPLECKPGSAYQHFPMLSAPDGESVVYEGTPFSPGEGAVIENEYLARRTPSGWQSTNLTPPLLQSKGGQGYKAFQGGLGAGVIEQLSPSLAAAAPAGYANLYEQSTDTPGSLTPLITEADASLTCAQGELKLSYAGASRDYSRQFFQASDALTPEAVGGCGEANLYEWAGGQLRALNLAPGEAVTSPGAALGSGTLLESGNPNSGFTPVFAHAISADGQRVFWTAASGALYVRVGGSETVEVPGPGNCRKSVPLAQRACFLAASATGSEVLLSNGRVYDLNALSGAYEEALDLTAGKGGFEGIVGQGEEGLLPLYFADTEVLAGENAAHQAPLAGKDNLYAFAGGTTAFIATLSTQDRQDFTAAPTLRTAESSPNGRWLAFLSRAPLTGYDNVGPCQLTGGGEILDVPCSEAFLYDSATGQLRCASCDPSGAAPIGQSVLPLILNAPAAMGQPPRYLTDSGRLYFDSRDSLVPTDTNDGVEDVYQFQPPGADALGACGLQAGCTSLISSGRGSSDSNFVAVDESGANVFFTSRDRLVPADTDELYDLYDARVGGGFPPVPAARECQSEACQPSQAAPSEQLPNSSATGPSGNVPQKGCKKGQVRRGERCVAKHDQKKHKHKKHKHKAKKANRQRGGSK